MKKMKLDAHDLCTIGMFTAIIAVLAQIIIPMPSGIPMTLQTFGVPLAGIILGKRKGTIAVIIYVLLGAIGVPVFSGFGGGIARIVGPNGGYILGYPLMAFFAGLGAGKGKVPGIIFGLALAIVAVYTFGTLQYMFITGNSLQVSFFACVLPFIPAEIVKASLAGTVGIKCRQALAKSGLARI